MLGAEQQHHWTQQLLTMAGSAEVLQVFDMFMALADKGRKNAGGAKVVETAAANNIPGDWRAAIEEWVAALLAARAAAVEAMEVEALAVKQQGHPGPQQVQDAAAVTNMTDPSSPEAAGDGLQNHDAPDWWFVAGWCS